jgi:phosphopentomutase
MGRAIVVVMDAVGAGALPDASDYGDPPDANTLVHLAEAVGGLELPVLGALGLGNIVAIEGVAAVENPVIHGRLGAAGAGKDSTAGHWELMGVVSEVAQPTYPDGFPEELVARLVEQTGHTFCCNRPYSGIDVINDYGVHHLQTGELILYTSADSVLQVAAHVGRVISLEELYRVCRAARELTDVGRVIARPFEGEPGAFVRTADRKDLALAPPARSALDALQEAGVPVHCVGKTRDLFAGVGVTDALPGATNEVSLTNTTRLIREADGSSLIFTNLIETDQIYGHRKDTAGFAAALAGIDTAVGEWLKLLRDDDLLILTADHGVDPSAPHSDHTREHVPLLAVAPGRPSARHDGALSDVGFTVVQFLTGAPDRQLPGRSFLP